MGGEAWRGCAAVRLAAAGQRGRPLELPGYAEGAWWVQDAAAALPAKLHGRCGGPGGGRPLRCAGRQGDAAGGDGREALGCRHLAPAHRAAARECGTRAGSRWRSSSRMRGHGGRPSRSMRVLLDAPCSALGIMRRHPEGVWRRDPKDLARFPAVQASAGRGGARHAPAGRAAGLFGVHASAGGRPRCDRGGARLGTVATGKDRAIRGPWLRGRVNG